MTHTATITTLAKQEAKQAVSEDWNVPADLIKIKRDHHGAWVAINKETGDTIEFIDSLMDSIKRRITNDNVVRALQAVS